MTESKTIIGWKEWCAFPDLSLPAIKAKVDTGAKTSCLHAYDIEAFEKENEKYVRFKIHPLQRNQKLECICEAVLSDYRNVTSSNGECEKRYVINTPLVIADKTVQSDVTLTSRHAMNFRMLLGRDDIRKAKLIVDSSKEYVLGEVLNIRALYKNHKAR